MQSTPLAIGIVLSIPDGWDHFIYHGYHYVRDEHGQFVIGSQVDLDAALEETYGEEKKERPDVAIHRRPTV